MPIDYTLSFPQMGNHADRIVWKRNFLDIYQIKGLEKEIKKLDYAEKAATIEASNEEVLKTYDPSIRSSKVKWLPKSAAFKVLYENIAERVLASNNENWFFDLHSMHEDIQYTEYHATEKGHYNWHIDLGPGFASLRKISLTINLSDPNEYEGGVLEFDIGGKVKTYGPREQGAICLFPSYLPHRVTPVTKGIRKSLVLWVGGKPFR
tara:strand:- start:2493 stop:3113 length:621 start_codon:yes stop_codon:yes gene_type:complete